MSSWVLASTSLRKASQPRFGRLLLQFAGFDSTAVGHVVVLLASIGTDIVVELPARSRLMSTRRSTTDDFPDRGSPGSSPIRELRRIRIYQSVLSWFWNVLGRAFALDNAENNVRFEHRSDSSAF